MDRAALVGGKLTPWITDSSSDCSLSSYGVTPGQAGTGRPNELTT